MTDTIIRLNVGGTIFQTWKSTIERLSYFKTLFDPSYKYKITKDKDGNIFIDRDPKLFAYILNYLRNNNMKQFNKYYKKRIDLEDELNYYGLDILKTHEPYLKNEYVILYDCQVALKYNYVGTLSIFIEKYDKIIEKLKSVEKIIKEYNDISFIVLLVTKLNDDDDPTYNYWVYHGITLRIIPLINNDDNNILYNNNTYKWSDRDIIKILQISLSYNDRCNLDLEYIFKPMPSYSLPKNVMDENEYNFTKQIIELPNIRKNFDSSQYENKLYNLK